MLSAAIDIGTNSILLLIAEQTSEGLTPLEDVAQTVRLGEKLSQTQILSQAGINRTLAGLADYAQRLQQYPIEKVICFGTEALRQAENADSFKAQLKQQFDWNIRILTGEEEAFYTFLGGISSLGNLHQEVIVIDIGGGSTEVVYGTSAEISYQESFAVGAVNLKEQFGLEEQISPQTQQAIQVQLAQLFGKLTSIPLGAAVLVTGGTAMTLAALALELSSTNMLQVPQGIDGHRLTYLEIIQTYQFLNRLSLAERSQLPGMAPGRADIILPALLILLGLMSCLQAPNMQVTVRGVRYGILL